MDSISASRVRSIRRCLARVFKIGIVVIFATSCGLLAGGRSLIYFPRPYSASELARAASKTQRIEFQTSEGRQVAFYLPPHLPDGRRQGVGAGTPLWMIFNGNGGRALDWLNTQTGEWDPLCGYLFFDYPGYGACEGKPTRESIAAAAHAALGAWGAALSEDSTRFAARVNLLGHSLGAAAALDLAASLGDETPHKIVLVAPFTSMLAMARRRIGWPLCYLLRDRYDNAARLNEIETAHPPSARPRVTILHGAIDEVIPQAMGRSLADAHRDWVKFVPLGGGGHNDVVFPLRAEIRAAMGD